MGTGATFVRGAAPFVVAGGAHVRRRTELELAAGAVGLLRETLVLGRSSEAGGAIRSTLRATLAGRHLFVEDLALDGRTLRGSPAVLGEVRVLGTVVLLGTRPSALEHPHETHLEQAAMAATWARWRDALAGRRRRLGGRTFAGMT